MASEQSTFLENPQNEIAKIQDEIEKFDFSKVEKLLAQDCNNPYQVRGQIREFKRFFALKAFLRDTNAKILSPSFKVDQAWHAMLQFPLDYVRLCDAILPVDVTTSRIIDHNPFGAEDGELQAKRYRETIRYYHVLFKEAPLAEFWERVGP